MSPIEIESFWAQNISVSSFLNREILNPSKVFWGSMRPFKLEWAFSALLNSFEPQFEPQLVVLSPKSTILHIRLLSSGQMLPSERQWDILSPLLTNFRGTTKAEIDQRNLKLFTGSPEGLMENYGPSHILQTSSIWNLFHCNLRISCEIMCLSTVYTKPPQSFFWKFKNPGGSHFKF